MPHPSIRLLPALLGGLVALGLADPPGGVETAPVAPPPSDEALLALAERGREVATYLQAIERARERLRHHPGEVPDPDRLVALSGREGWRIILLKEGEGPAQKGPKILAEIGYSPDSAEAGALRTMVPPRPATTATTAYLRALETAAVAVPRPPGASGPFEEALVRERDGAFSVYLMSRPPATSAARFGGDFLVRIARTGRQVVAVEPLHEGEPIDIQPAGRGSGQATLHSHAAGDLPSPTDVARVIVRPDLAPHLVLTPRFMFRLDARGGVTYLGPNRTVVSPGGRR